MGQFAEMLSTTARRPRGFADQLLDGISAEQFGRLPAGGGDVIKTNHPAWIFGHLSIYPAKLMSFLGRDAGDAAVPEAWLPLFQPGSECRDDADGNFYPAMDTLVSGYRRAYDQVLDVLPEVDDEKLLEPMTVEPYKSFMPTIGVAVTLMLVSHVGFHLGQLSAWRRCMGLGSAT